MKSNFTMQLGVFFGVLFAVSAVKADLYGPVNGRSADLSTLTDLSVEGSFNTASGYDYYGVRLNYRLAPGLVAFGDVGIADEGLADGPAFGIGLYYQLQDLFTGLDSSIKASYHLGVLETNNNVDLDVSALEVDLLVSGRTPLATNGLEWYANIGIVYADAEVQVLGRTVDDSETDILLGGGLLLPLSFGEVYGGIDYIDDAILSIGVRYNLR